MIQIEFTTKTTPYLTDFDTIIVPVFKDGKLHPSAKSHGLDTVISQIISSGDFKPKAGNVFMLVQESPAPRLCLVGMDQANNVSEKFYIEACTAVAKSINNSGAANCLSLLADATPATKDLNWAIYQQTLVFQNSHYDYNHFSRGKHPSPNYNIRAICFQTAKESQNTTSQDTINQAQATALGMNLTKDLANMPSNFCTPSYLAETAKDLANNYGFDCNILDRDEMLEMGMGSFMSVAQGGDEPPKMICLSYQGGKKGDAPIALVGKGVTFDTGGISLKPGAGMDEMKYDMGGAATVLGVFKSLGELKPNINVVAVIPSTENMPSGDAIKPGDVVSSLAGQTIEILNTDAEGRLILCDALTYCQQTYQPKKIIDMATLTGACIIALGHHISAVLGNDQELVDSLILASNTTYDRFWQMPLSDEYDEQLKSNFADMANIGGRPAGTITAAQFLARFTKDVSWAHLDIAGTAWVSGANKGATGRPVPALVEYLMQESSN